MGALGLSLRSLDSSEWGHLGVLFQRVFGQPLPHELIEFKYGEGNGASIALIDTGGNVVAHCGMLYQRILVAGRHVQGVQYGDLMVDPKFRGMHSLDGLPFNQVFRGALQHVRSTFGEHLVFGYPSKRATRLGEKLGLIAEIDRIDELAWVAVPGSVSAHLQSTYTSKLGVMLDQFWTRMKADLSDSIVLVRDSAYWKRRYFDHPVHQYQIYVLHDRWWRPPIGVFVLREVGAGIELVDWVGALSNSLAIVEEARKVAAKLGFPSLTTWQTSGFSQRVSLGQPERRALPIVAAVGGQLPMGWVHAFKGRIWAMPGDTDYH